MVVRNTEKTIKKEVTCSMILGTPKGETKKKYRQRDMVLLWDYNMKLVNYCNELKRKLNEVKVVH